MKKNILLLVASAALLASCGSNSAVPAAPTVKEEVKASAVSEAATKALNKVIEAKGLTLDFGVDLEVAGKTTLPGANLGMTEETVELNEKIALKDLTVKEVASIKDGKLVASGTLGGAVNAELTLPKMPTEEGGKVTLEKKNLNLKLDAKDYLADDVLYLDGSGLFDAYKQIADIATSYGARVEGPTKADDMKVKGALPEGSCASFAGALASLSAYVPQVTGFIEGLAADESVKFAKFSDGSFGVELDALKYAVAMGVIPTGYDLSGCTAKATITFAEAGKVNAYAELSGKTTIELDGQNVEVEAKGKISLGLAVGDVTVATVSNPDSYTEVPLSGILPR